MNTISEDGRVAPRRARGVRFLLPALVAIALVAFFGLGIGGPAASNASPTGLPSVQPADPVEQLVPMYAASSGDDVGPGQAEPVLVSSP